MQQQNNRGDIIRKILPEISIKFLIVFISFVLSLFLFGLITQEVIFKNETNFDREAGIYLSGFANQDIIHTMTLLTFFGSSRFLFPAYALLVIYFAIKKKIHHSINIGLIGITSTALLHALKLLFVRDRPESTVIAALKTYSYPSGHALSSFIFCSILVYITWRSNLHVVVKWLLSVLFLMFSLLIGLSRILLNVHYATDVIAGICLGFVWVILSFWMLRRIQKKDPVPGA